ncbi:MAG: hypothetical protein A2X25_03965 [Chloroflexi bacterium GWB2_49_20]|nr:MAG: hypothetical protein A2X25_03965 [Chloroflexi bacterium GWB2_49_20]OGN76740.1 MAG: hypothetical protein A2X26_11055 [Chloroflexi bacterium GWC2_49_37]OGN83700.1 MAG: hypothetical protein A2X27_01710 [Chloroflexi bacterium GWD2_49_16]HBG74177.1 hypothetical protein [Anaerolineae bacterium]HCC79005.1 hypothetical protein [Anaerolineae bacterium]
MKSLSRRDFLKLGSLAMGSLAFTPFLPQITEFNDVDLVRIGTKSVSVYSKPYDTSNIVTTWKQDEVVNIYEVITAETPAYNPIWYRVWGGYMHRAHLQRVKIIYNTPGNNISEKGQLGEITVPYTDSMHFTQNFGWNLSNRLYYGTVHWIVGIDEGPDKQPWYRLRDELNSAIYNVPAIHVRLIPDEELAPITPEIPFNQKRIDVQLSSQTLTCYEYDNIVLQTKVSTGLPSTTIVEGIPTATPKGDFNVQVKMPSKHMGDGNLTSDLQAYELVGVPWNCFFTQQGHAFHGAYWHDNFGVPMSHGCVNMRIADAKWLFLWSMPVAKPGQESTINYGTSIHIY